MDHASFGLFSDACLCMFTDSHCLTMAAALYSLGAVSACLGLREDW